MKNATMLYWAPGPHEIHGGFFDYTIVDEDAISSTVDAGWRLTTPEALEAQADRKQAAIDAAKADVDRLTAELEAAAAPSRDALEAQATELGITFDGRNSDKKLADKIGAEVARRAAEAED